MGELVKVAKGQTIKAGGLKLIVREKVGRYAIVRSNSGRCYYLVNCTTFDGAQFKLGGWYSSVDNARASAIGVYQKERAAAAVEGVKS